MRLLLFALLVAVANAQVNYNYGQVLQKSLLFYEAQRTGVLPANNRIPWRGNSFVEDKDTANGWDLSGGYFDAGDFVKFGFPGNGAITMLAWGMVDSADGYKKGNEWTNALAALKWGTDFLIKAHPTPNEFYVQVGDGNIDHSYWGRPEDWTTSNGPRPVLKANGTMPASEVCAETAAAFAASALVFRGEGDTAYANVLLQHARDLYNFATTVRGDYHVTFPELEEFYKSWSGYGDEFLWAAGWIWRATGEDSYQTDYNRWWTEFNLNYRPGEVSWDLKLAQAQTLLAKIDGDAKFVNAAKTFCDWVVYNATKTPRGLVFLSPWGSLRHASNAVFVCLQAANAGITPTVYRDFAKTQIDYMLGNSGRSFVCGFGQNPPTQPHHASSSCRDRPAPCDWSDFSKSGPNSQVLNGALVGGPDANDNYVDDRADYVMNEVTLDYNAGFQGAVAEMCLMYCP